MDRRGHFRAVGETTTADLVNYKARQREAAEEELVKGAAKAQAAREAAALQKEARPLPALPGLMLLCKHAWHLSVSLQNASQPNFDGAFCCASHRSCY